MKNMMPVKVGSRTETIPQAWLMGATYTRTRFQGMTHKAAVLDAIRHWIEQGDMAIEFEAQRRAA